MGKSIRKLFVIILAALLLFSIAGCTQKTDYVLRCYLIENGSGANFPVELNVDGAGYGLFPDMWKRWSFKDEKAAATKTVTYNGVEFSAEYNFSRCINPTSFHINFYFAKSEEAGVMFFYYNGVTDELIGMYPYTLNTFKATEEVLPEIDTSKEALEALARQYAADYVDIDNYTLVDMHNESRNGRTLWGYYFKFSRLINDRESTDCVEVRISPKGQLADLILGDIGKFTQEHEETLAVFADADIDALIADTIPEDSTLYIQEVKYLRYAITPEGQAVLEATLRLEDHADEEFWTQVIMIFTVEKASS